MKNLRVNSSYTGGGNGGGKDAYTLKTVNNELNYYDAIQMTMVS